MRQANQIAFNEGGTLTSMFLPGNIFFFLLAPPPADGRLEVLGGRGLHLRSSQIVYLSSVHPSVRPSITMNQSSVFLPMTLTQQRPAMPQSKPNKTSSHSFSLLQFFFSQVIMEHSENMVFKSLAATAADGECVPRCVGGAEWRPQGG